jgi:NitT/TauT family transport system substrate-binding protein
MFDRIAHVALAAALACTAGLAAGSGAHAADKVTFGTDWKAEAEYGGFYQAVATGLYAKHGLDVSLRQGGPQVNHTQLLAAGKIDFNIGNSFLSMNFVKEQVPLVAIAAFFQKDAQVLIAHAGSADSLAALKGKPIMIGSDTRVGSWLFLKAKFGYGDDQIRPYNFSIAPWLADKNAVQQGYATSEPYLMEKEGAKPVVFLLADNGYDNYGNVVQTSLEMTAKHPDVVQRFVDASAEGWYSYLYGDPAPANALIKKDNPEMTDDLIANGIAKMKEYGIVDSGDALTGGIGAMSAARWQRFFEVMSAQGLYPKDLAWQKAFTTEFVNKKVGMEMKK